MNNAAKPFVVANGIDAENGQYLTPPLSVEELYDRLMDQSIHQAVKADDQALKILRRRNEAHYGPPAGVDPANLAATGWGVIFASTADPAIREALAELLAWRQSQAGKYYKEFTGEQGFQVNSTPEESYTRFLARAGISFGSPKIANVPYYLLLVGGPEVIPYRFQQLLDTQYAVGRIYFETLDEYRQYAHSVVQAEQQTLTRERRMVLAGTYHADDPATEASATLLLPQVHEACTESSVTESWQIDRWTPEQTTKAGLQQLLGGAATPALSFIACHGMGLGSRRDLQRQREQQGALLGQDWPGPQAWGQHPIDPAHYLTAQDLEPNAQLTGTIAFLFACFGAGTPRYDEYAHGKQSGRQQPLSLQPFVARLPQRLLSHPQGGALAVIGHVDQIWSHSFTTTHGTNAQTFADVLIWLMSGARVGFAMESLSMRFAEISGVLNAELEDGKFGKQLDPQVIVDLWTMNNDARGYILLGDPAVRLTFAEA